MDDTGRKDLLHKLTVAGLLTRFSEKYPLWREAFEAYNAQADRRVGMCCADNYRKVLQWLQA